MRDHTGFLGIDSPFGCETAGSGHRPAALTAWLGAAPTLRENADLVVALTMDVLARLDEYPIRSVYTDEPRYYRTTTRGRALLADALRAGRVRFLALGTDPRPGVANGAEGEISLGFYPGLDAASVSLRISGQPATRPETALFLRDFVTRWFAPLNAASAFTSDNLQDYAGITVHEQDRGPLLSWVALRRYVRGVFWGNGLGPDLCERLGGREHVVATAPVASAAPLGDGVWLQLSDAPPAPAEAYDRLAAFLAPVLNWTTADMLAADAEARAAWNAAREQSAATPPLEETGLQVPESAPTMGRGRRRRLVPMRILESEDNQLGLNIYLDHPPMPAERAAIAATMDEWYREGYDGAFNGEEGETGFHFLDGPTGDGAVLRWFVDTGLSDQRLALRALRQRLAALPGVEVVRLVVGTESAR